MGSVKQVLQAALDGDEASLEMLQELFPVSVAVKSAVAPRRQGGDSAGIQNPQTGDSG